MGSKGGSRYRAEPSFRPSLPHREARATAARLCPRKCREVSSLTRGVQEDGICGRPLPGEPQPAPRFPAGGALRRPRRAALARVLTRPSQACSAPMRLDVCVLGPHRRLVGSTSPMPAPSGQKEGGGLHVGHSTAAPTTRTPKTELPRTCSPTVGQPGGAARNRAESRAAADPGGWLRR